MSTLISVVALVAVIYWLNNHRKELRIHWFCAGWISALSTLGRNRRRVI